MRLARLTVLATLALALGLVAASHGDAQPPDKVWRVAWLSPAVARSAAHYQALERRLRELGYVEGRNLVIDFRTAAGKFERLPELATELVGRQPHVLVAVTTPGALAVKNATRTIPVVIATVADPVVSKIVTGMARPGGNITGVSLLNVELSGKALQLLKEAVPSLSRPAVLLNELNQSHAEIMKATRAAAVTLGVTLQPLNVQKPDDLPRAFDAITGERADGLLVLPDPLSLARRKSIIDFAASRRLPAIYPFREMVDEGGLLCYGPNLVEHFRAAAEYVHKILKGGRPGDLPIAQATKFDFVINLKTAKALGLTIPPAVLARADEIIQ
jgi:ABC-type uncharacterized transport system substrate-binding protein